MTRRDGAARPEPLDLFPGPVLQHASVREAVCRTLGESIDLPRLDGQRGADAILFISVGLVMRPQLPIAVFHILTHLLCDFTVY